METAPKVLRNCSETAPELPVENANETQISLIFPNRNFQPKKTTAPKLLRNCTETALKNNTPIGGG